MPPDTTQAMGQASADDAALAAAKRAMLGFATMGAGVPALHGAAEAFTPTDRAVASLAMLDLVEREAGRHGGVRLKRVTEGTRLQSGGVLQSRDVHNYLKRANLKAAGRGCYRFGSAAALEAMALALQKTVLRAKDDPQWASRRRRRTRQQRQLPAHMTPAHNRASA